MSKKQKIDPEEVKKMEDPNFFYEYGDNPAMKQLLQFQAENNAEGVLYDYRTYYLEKYRKFIIARDLEDILQRDLKCITFGRTFAVFIAATLATMNVGVWCMQLLPIGKHGITRVSQTQLYHTFGPLGYVGVLGLSWGSLYLYYKTAKFTAKKFYWHILMGHRQWEYEMDRQNNSYGEYYFSDTPTSSDENFPTLAKILMAKNKRDAGGELLK